jgi:hypothetical protein
MNVVGAIGDEGLFSIGGVELQKPVDGGFAHGGLQVFIISRRMRGWDLLMLPDQEQP